MARIGSMLLLGLAAFGAYKYSNMSKQEKERLKETGKKAWDNSVRGLKKSIGRHQPVNARH